jgi:hypothetical protein
MGRLCNHVLTLDAGCAAAARVASCGRARAFDMSRGAAGAATSSTLTSSVIGVVALVLALRQRSAEGKRRDRADACQVIYG